MTKIDHSTLTARPEEEDFYHKYTEEGQGIIGAKLLDRYFKAVHQLIEASSIKKGVALEVGCGAGFSTKRLRDMLPTQVSLEASEYVESMLSHARKINPSVTIRQESVYDLQRKDNSLDLIFLLEVLEHLDYPDKALDEIARVLKPDGYLILGVPREPLWRMLNMARFKYIKDFGNTTGHLNHWSSRSIAKFVGEQVGEIIKRKTPAPWTIVLAQKS